jgi:hypothetical protein
MDKDGYGEYRCNLIYIIRKQHLRYLKKYNILIYILYLMSLGILSNNMLIKLINIDYKLKDNRMI